MKWLVTAFEPFGGFATNSSLAVAEELNAMAKTGGSRAPQWAAHVRFHFPVPVEFGRAWESVRREITPDLGGVLALGQAGGRPRINLERLALNWVESKTLDNALKVPASGKILGEEDLLWSPIPWDRFSPARPELFDLSFSAGAYVCNFLMYHSLLWARENRKLAGFVHIPHLSSAGATGSPAIRDEDAVSGVSDILNFLVNL